MLFKRKHINILTTGIYLLFPEKSDGEDLDFYQSSKVSRLKLQSGPPNKAARNT